MNSKNTSQGCAIAVIAVAGIVLWGWFFDVLAMRSVLPQFVAMNPVTALCLILSGAALLLRQEGAPSSYRRAAQMLSTVILVTGTLRIVGAITQGDLGLDQWLFSGKLGDNRMTVNTAFCFVLTGISLLGIDIKTKRGWCPAQGLVLVLLSVTSLVTVGYAYGVMSFSRINASYFTMAVNTALCFLAVGVGILFARPERGFMAVCSSPGAGGVTARRLLPAAILLPIAFGYLRLKCEILWPMDLEVGVVLYALGMSVLFGMLTWWLAAKLFRLDRLREKITIENHQANVLLESMKDFAIFMLDPEGRIITWNAGAEKIKGYSKEDIVGGQFSCFYSEEDIREDKPGKLLRETMAAGRREDVGWRLRKDGHRFWADVVLSAVKDANGRLMGFAVITRDLTDRMQTELALHKSELEFRTLSEMIPQMVWICLPDGMNVYFNHQWVDYTGLTLEESYGRGWNTPFHPDDKQAAWDAWKSTVESGGKVPYKINCRLRAANGSYRWFLMKGVPFNDATDGIIKWFGTCTDIEDLKKAEQDLQHARDELQRGIEELKHSQNALLLAHKLEAVGRLAAGVAHEKLALNLPPVLINAMEIQQVIINLANNALDAMNDKGTLTIQTELFQESGKSWVRLS